MLLHTFAHLTSVLFKGTLFVPLVIPLVYICHMDVRCTIKVQKVQHGVKKTDKKRYRLVPFISVHLGVYPFVYLIIIRSGVYQEMYLCSSVTST